MRQLVGRSLEPIVRNLGCFPARKIYSSEKCPRNRETRAVRPTFFVFMRIFGPFCRRRRVVAGKYRVFERSGGSARVSRR